MIFQEPLLALDPVYTVGSQIIEAILRHENISRDQARARALSLFERVRIPSPERRLDAYPHEMSGGMRQRAMISLALASEPQLLLADEPTTALDVTIQAQILDLLKGLQKELSMAVVLISHNLGVVSDLAQRVAVMYAGQMVEVQSTAALFDKPRHPYTNALMRALPQHNLGKTRLQTIAGLVPGISDRPPGCLFAPRCAHARSPSCDTSPSVQPLNPGLSDCVRCHFPLSAGP